MTTTRTPDPTDDMTTDWPDALDAPPVSDSADGLGFVLDDSERTRCEIWTRVMGYHRPVHAFNAGKQSEHADRVTFQEPAERA